MEHAKRGANATMTVNLPDQTIEGPDGDPIAFEIDPWLKHCLVNGLDEIALTMEKAEPITAHEAHLAETRPWV